MPIQWYLHIMAGTILPLPYPVLLPSFWSGKQRRNLAHYLEPASMFLPNWTSTPFLQNCLQLTKRFRPALPGIYLWSAKLACNTSSSWMCNIVQLTMVLPSASGIPEASGQQDPSSAQSVPSTSEAGSTTEKERGRAGFKCAECGVVKYRKPDFEGHLWSKHGLGDPIVCNRGTCGGKSYSSASSLRQHIRTIHQGQYKFNCDRCDYGTDNYDCLTSHKARKHRVRQKTPKGKVIVYACKKCKKEFDAPHLLRKHETNETCTRKKTIPCPDCTSFYKTKEGLQYHQEQQHKGKKSPCSTCGKMVSEKAMPNHQKQHSSQRAVQRAKD